MAESGSEGAGSRRSGLILMIAAFVVMGGFLYWLSINAESASVAIEESAADTTDEDSTVPTVELSTFSANPREYQDELIRLRNLRVASGLGAEAFWFQLDTEDPYLVKLDSTLVAEGITVSSGDVARRIEGRVRVMSDSVLDAWEAGGAFTAETDRVEAQYATTFIEASEVEIESASEDDEEGDGGGGGSGGGGS